ncbi:hypothetical protein [Methyloversatilis sp. XJ19-49]|uniref:hypothetical protein n=1 Tax=Methyloversatilis sp. XJ19-49 TaxID=2963429 RepID=UPI00211C9989|nr:hypothetical protein [Methyloversatilis sp. XJ19-49]MCQ9377751.1 hypothetical protein [Methyloversatilis sp. XJ19-49]
MNQKIVLAVIAIIPATLTALAGYSQGQKSSDSNKSLAELDSKKISLQASQNPNFKQLVYPNYGIMLNVPANWTAEDSPARLAGGEFNLVSRYEETKGSIGMNFRLRPVQPNYINDLPAQVENQRVTLEKNFGAVKVEDTTISGVQGKLFTYESATGKRKMLIKMYWVRVVPDVQLQILCAQYLDAADFNEFWMQATQAISSIVIAIDSWQARYKKDKGI